MEAAEADFQRFYGIDLDADLEVMGVRRLWVLTSQLPPEGRLGELLRAREKKNRVTSVAELSAMFGRIGK